MFRRGGVHYAVCVCVLLPMCVMSTHIHNLVLSVPRCPVCGCGTCRCRLIIICIDLVILRGPVLPDL